MAPLGLEPRVLLLWPIELRHPSEGVTVDQGDERQRGSINATSLSGRADVSASCFE